MPLFLKDIKILQTLPKSISSIAYFFHFGSSGVNLMAFAFKTPIGMAIIMLAPSKHEPLEHLTWLLSFFREMTSTTWWFNRTLMFLWSARSYAKAWYPLMTSISLPLIAESSWPYSAPSLWKGADVSNSTSIDTLYMKNLLLSFDWLNFFNPYSAVNPS